MSHINSYRRKNLGDKSPNEIFSLLYDEDILKMMGLTFIPHDEITLSPSLSKKRYFFTLALLCSKLGENDLDIMILHQNHNKITLFNHIYN